MNTILKLSRKPILIWLKTISLCLLFIYVLAFSSCQKDSDNLLTEEYLKGLELSALSTGSQSEPIIYFDHKTFTRTSETPFIEKIKLENPDIEHFDGDFVLKIQNGKDMYSRVSSAEIWVDGVLVVGPSAFSKNISFITKQISGLTTESVLEVKLNSSPGSFIDLWIEGTLKPNHALLTNKGGEFSFLEGNLIFTVPEGAIDEKMFISVEDITSNLSLEVQEQFIIALKFSPEGIKFNAPIAGSYKYTENIESGKVPKLIQFDIISGYTLLKQSRNNLEKHSIEFELFHFSTYGFTTKLYDLLPYGGFTRKTYKVLKTGITQQDPNINSSVFFDMVKKDVSRAFERWLAYYNILPFNSDFIETDADPDITIHFITSKEADDEYRGVGRIDPLDEGITTGVVLQNIFPDKWGKWWILLNNEYLWRTTDRFINYENKFPADGQNIVETVVTHEIGHMTGRRDIDDYSNNNCYQCFSLMGYNLYSSIYPRSIPKYDIDLLFMSGFTLPFYNAVELSPIGSTILSFSTGDYLEDPLKVKVTDPDGNGVPGVTVVFYSGLQHDIGQISNQIATTDPNGIAKINSWKLPDAEMEIKIEAKAWLDPDGINPICAKRGQEKDIVQVANFTIKVVDDQDDGFFYKNEFSGDLSDWTAYEGSWLIQNGMLVANYGIGCGTISCPQGDLILKDQFQPSGDWKVFVDFTYAGDSYHAASSAAMTLWVNETKKIRISVGNGGFNNWGNTQLESIGVGFGEWNGTWYKQINKEVNYNWFPKDWQTMTVEKTGNIYKVYVNNVYLWEYNDTYLNGSGKIGLQTYGPKTYDNFFIKTNN